MARERQLEGEEMERETGFSDVELDEDGNPIDDEGEEEEEEGEDGDGDGAEDRGDNVLDDDGDGDGSDLDALRAIAGEGRETIPRARLNEIAAERDHWRNLAQQQAQGIARGAQAEQRQERPEPAFDLKGKLKARADALLEGDTDKVVAIDEEIENHRNTVVRREGEQAGRTAATQAYQTERVQEIIDASFQRYPFLNDANADFSGDALRDVMMYRNRYMEDGDSMSLALRKAVNRVCPYYADELYPDRTGGKRRAKDDDDGDGKSREREKGRNERDPRKIQRNARAGNRLPPNIGSSGTGNRAARRMSGERDAKDIPSREYHDMPDEERKRLRGDFVE